MNDEIRCVLLFRDEQGLGHIPFIFFLCTNLPENYTIHIILGSKITNDKFPGAIIHKIPDDVNFSFFSESRSNYIADITNQIDPHILFLDHFPFGRYKSILDINFIASYVHMNGGKVVTIMRDMYMGKSFLDNRKYSRFIFKLFSIKKEQLLNFVHKNMLYILRLKSKLHTYDIYFVQIFLYYYLEKSLIDCILVFGDKNIYDIKSEFLLSEISKRKIYHMGYIPLKKLYCPETRVNLKKNILVSSGGNVAAKDNFLSLLKFLSKQSNFEVKILLGPYIDNEILLNIYNIFDGKNHVSILDFNDKFDILLQKSDYFFGYGGYGTFQHLFHYSGKAFIMSNYNLTDFKARYYEQKYRTKHFENILNVTYLYDFSDENLQKCLRKSIMKKPNISKISFCNEYILKSVLENIVRGE